MIEEILLRVEMSMPSLLLPLAILIRRLLLRVQEMVSIYFLKSQWHLA
jgi:hypothetical protein